MKRPTPNDHSGCRVPVVGVGGEVDADAGLATGERERAGAVGGAEIAIPLIVNDEFLGVLDVQSPKIGAFGSTEQMVLKALAAEVASAIYKAQQLAREQEQAWITTAQLQVAEAIGRYDDRSEMLSAVARLVPILAGVNICGYLLWRDEIEHYYGEILVDANGDEDDEFTHLELAIGDWGPLDAVHIGAEVLTTTHLPPWLGKWPTECLRLYPLLSSQGEHLGVMFVDLGLEDSCADFRDENPIDRTVMRPQEELIQSP